MSPFPPSNTRVLFLNHADVILDPEAAARSISGFLGARLNTAAMVAEVNPSLHRNRAENRNPREEPVALLA
jgi:hypothetical protein